MQSEGGFWKSIKPGVVEIVSALFGVVVGSIITQFAIPVTTPYIDMWTYQYTGFNVYSSRYVVIADIEQAKATPPQRDLVTFQRLFCGSSKICIQRVMKFDSNLHPDSWSFDQENDLRKTVVLGQENEKFTAIYIDQKSASPGYYKLSQIPSDRYVGFGYGCFVKNRVKTSGPYYAYYGDLDLGIISSPRISSAEVEQDYANKFKALFQDAKNPNDIVASIHIECESQS